ncbi:MAG TPA: hypothetical protein VGW34_08940 [Allosphingosinicella sp.]|nr:hypothetical protein [Allosphingosinicella sp.]
MTNLNAIMGGSAWIAVSALLACAALEPVAVAAAAPHAQFAKACASGSADCDERRA